MKIPNALPQYEAESAFIIAAGKQDAAMYWAHDGFLDRVDVFKIPTPHYSDHEGVRGVRSGRGTVGASGGTYEHRDDDVIRDFIKEFKERIKRAPKDVADVFIFASAKAKNRIKEALPTELRNKVRAVVEGNHFATSPLDLMRMLPVSSANENILIDPEARRILGLSRQAREVVRGRP